ncbi:type II secretion system F family protein [Gordonia sp. CPCC 205515]|uniref:type II secretion system F family protein n=1 Tax=Gordonia sp. CPCC 205515 TaxID=3140791 RepID=UPI003AF3F82E
MTFVLTACAIAVLWWPATRVQYRLWAVGRSAPKRPAGVRWPAILMIPIVALLVSGVPAAISAGIGIALLLRRRNRRLAERRHGYETDALLTGLSVMIAELSVGAPPVRACAAAATEINQAGGETPAVAVYFAAMAARAELGGRIRVDDDGSPEQSRVAAAWQIAERHGLPLVDLLESVRTDLLARRQFADRTRAALAGPRATATVLAGLPVLGVLLGHLMGAHPIGVLLGTGWGGVLLVVGTSLAAVGLVWSESITDRAVVA